MNGSSSSSIFILKSSTMKHITHHATTLATISRAYGIHENAAFHNIKIVHSYGLQAYQRLGRKSLLAACGQIFVYEKSDLHHNLLMFIHLYVLFLQRHKV
jgi:hypothetical protein